MKFNKKQLLLAVAIIMLLVAATFLGLYLISKHQGASTAEINSLLKRASIEPIDDWKLYPRCSQTDVPLDGYLLASSKSISNDQSEKLKTIAISNEMTVKNQEVGYQIKQHDWDMIVADVGGSQLMQVTITLDKMPKEHNELDSLCG